MFNWDDAGCEVSAKSARVSATQVSLLKFDLDQIRRLFEQEVENSGEQSGEDLVEASDGPIVATRAADSKELPITRDLERAT
jgi:hypothetical protein